MSGSGNKKKVRVGVGLGSGYSSDSGPDKDVLGSKETELGILKDKIKIHGRLMDRRLNWFCLRMLHRFVICAARCLFLQVLNLNQNLTNISPKTSAQTISLPIYKWMLLIPISDYFTFW